MFKYEDLTAYEKKYLCNGAGRKGWQGWIVPEFVFTEPSNKHDFRYWQGCTEADRKFADREYLFGLLDRAEYRKNLEKRFILMRIFLRRMAFIYYTAVTECGGSRSLGGFHYDDFKRTKIDLIHEMEAA